MTVCGGTKNFLWGASRGQNTFLRGKNSKICRKWLILTILFSSSDGGGGGGGQGGRASDWGKMPPHAPIDAATGDRQNGGHNHNITHWSKRGLIPLSFLLAAIHIHFPITHPIYTTLHYDNAIFQHNPPVLSSHNYCNTSNTPLELILSKHSNMATSYIYIYQNIHKITTSFLLNTTSIL